MKLYTNSTVVPFIRNMGNITFFWGIWITMAFVFFTFNDNCFICSHSVTLFNSCSVVFALLWLVCAPHNVVSSAYVIKLKCEVDSAMSFMYTVYPLSNDHPHQRPSLLYDHISCDGQCFLFVRSLTSDHPSDATSDRVRWDFLSRGRPHRVFQNDCGMNVR